MFEAAERNPRRTHKPNVPNISSDFWLPDLSSLILLAVCQDFQYTGKSNFNEDESIHMLYEADLGIWGRVVLPATANQGETVITPSWTLYVRPY